MEMGLRQALHKDGCRLLGKLIEESGAQLDHQAQRPGERCYAQRSRRMETILGPVELQRSYYHSPGKGRVPLDEALGLIDSYTPALARLMCRAGANDNFQRAGEDLRCFGAIEVGSRQIQRMVGQIAPDFERLLRQPEEAPPTTQPIPVLYTMSDGTGVPMRKEELQGRKGRQPDGSAKTREVKLGCVFTQHTTDSQGFPIRDEASTSYVASFETASDFAPRLRQEAIRRGMAYALKTVFLGDGAAWVWELARVNFPNAICILDFYHATQHLKNLTDALYGQDSQESIKHFHLWKIMLLNDQLQVVLAQATAKLPKNQNLQKLALQQIAYFNTNAQRMRYASFRSQGLFIGSGVVEAGCKSLIAKRFKQSGMLWSLPGASHVLALRCALASNRFDHLWSRRTLSQPQLALAA